MAGRVDPESAQGPPWAHVPQVPRPRPGGGPCRKPQPARGLPPGPHLPPLPYLQGAGVAVDQQAEDGDLDAAGACRQSTGQVLPGVRASGDPGTLPVGWAPRLWPSPPTLSRETPARRLFLVKRGLQAAYHIQTHAPSLGDKDASPAPDCPVGRSQILRHRGT